MPSARCVIVACDSTPHSDTASLRNTAQVRHLRTQADVQSTDWLLPFLSDPPKRQGEPATNALFGRPPIRRAAGSKVGPAFGFLAQRQLQLDIKLNCRPAPAEVADRPRVSLPTREPLRLLVVAACNLYSIANSEGRIHSLTKPSVVRA